MADSSLAPEIEVLSPGLATTVQDGGRHGHRHLGVASAGAADPWSHAIANLLVGNPVDGNCATLEITLSGPRLRFNAAARIALCGGGIKARIDDVEVPTNRPVDVPAGSVLALGRCLSGARSYLAVHGGIAVPRVLGSASTDLRGGFGGCGGRSLQAGDRLGITPFTSDPQRVRTPDWWIDASPHATPAHHDYASVIRVLPGHQTADALFAHTWTIDGRSNRQGLRLQGEPLMLDERREQVSEPVAPGTLQLPPDGQPILLLADAQTHGGYPRIGHAIRADWPLLAQARPNDRLRFVPCTPAQAHAALREQRQQLHRMALAIQSRHPRA